MQSPDELLSIYLGQKTEPEAEETLRRLLLDHAAPVARSVLFSLAPREVEDGVQQVLLDLTIRLRRVRQGEETEIYNFPAYVATTARRAASLLARRGNPSRFRLRNRLRYALRTSAALSLWTDAAERPVCGPRRFMGSEADPASPAALETMSPPSSSEPLTTQLARVLAVLPGPALLDDVATHFSQMEGNSARLESFEEAWTVEGRNLAREMDLRASLQHLWQEIADLPRNQRVALLLNLRDHIGDSALRIFPALGIASIRRLAEAMELDPLRLAELWSRLPLDDNELAEMLSLTRQQVINLRKSARMRLDRRAGAR